MENLSEIGVCEIPSLDFSNNQSLEKAFTLSFIIKDHRR